MHASYILPQQTELRGQREICLLQLPIRRADRARAHHHDKVVAGLELLLMQPVDFPQETAIGALSLYVSGGSVGDFQPMNVNFGIISPLGCRVKGKRNKNAEISKRSLEIIESLKAKEVFHCEDNH